MNFEEYNESFAGIRVSAIDLGSVLDCVSEALHQQQRLVISYINPDYVLKALRNSKLRKRINSFDLVLADGIGVIWGARFFNVIVPERLGTDHVAPPVFDICAKGSFKVFLFGSKPGIAKNAASNLSQYFPDIKICGFSHGWFDVLKGHPGYFDPEDNDAIVRQINESGADFLLVSLPTPLQQDWVHSNASKLNTSVIMTGGSYIDHLAESPDLFWYPRWIDRFNLNWLYRLYRDPRRLWKRYTLDLLWFFWELFRIRLKRQNGE